MTLKDSIPESTNRASTSSHHQPQNNRINETDPLIHDFESYSRRYDSIAPPDYNSISTPNRIQSDHSRTSLEDLPPHPQNNDDEERSTSQTEASIIAKRKRKKQRRRRIKFFTITFFFWVCMTVILIRKFSKSDQRVFLPPPDPPIEDGEIIGRPEWSEPFKIPLPPEYRGKVNVNDLYFKESILSLSQNSSPSFFFHSRGLYDGGLSLVFHEIDPEDPSTSTVTMTFQIMCTDPRFIDTVSFTKHKRNDGIEGFGLYRSENRNEIPEKNGERDEGMIITAMISFPILQGAELSYYPQVEIDVPNEVDSGDLGSHVKIGDFKLRAKEDCSFVNILTNSSFFFESTGSLKRFRSSGTIKSPSTRITSSGDILLSRVESEVIELKSQKMIRSSDRLIGNQIHLDSLYGGIATAIEVFQSSKNHQALVNLTNSFGGIIAEIFLPESESSPQDDEDEISVSVESLTGFVGLKYADYSEKVRLNSSVKNNRGGVSVNLPESFNGEFDYKNSNGDPVKIDFPKKRFYKIEKVKGDPKLVKGLIGVKNEKEARDSRLAFSKSNVISRAGTIVGTFQ